MINIPIDKRRDVLKRVYERLNTSSIARKHTLSELKELAISIEHDSCNKSTSESEYLQNIRNNIIKLEEGFNNNNDTNKIKSVNMSAGSGYNNISFVRRSTKLRS